MFAEPRRSLQAQRLTKTSGSTSEMGPGERSSAVQKVGASAVAMHRFINGDDRLQLTLLPNSLEDYVSEENPVRVIGSNLSHSRRTSGHVGDRSLRAVTRTRREDS